MSSIELVYFINTEKNRTKPTFRLVENKLVFTILSYDKNRSKITRKSLLLKRVGSFAPDHADRPYLTVRRSDDCTNTLILKP